MKQPRVRPPTSVAVLVLTIGLVLTYYPRRSTGAILSSTSLARCDDYENHLECREKLLISMIVENDKLYETEHLEVSIDCFQEDGEDRCLQSNMTIGITKTPVVLLYSLSNPKMFNGRPYEEYVESGYGSGRDSCVDSELRSDVTCGWATFDGSEIIDSQGFCCKCPSFGGEKISRGFRDCSYSLSWMLEGTPSSAHCLRYDDNWWYRGYQIGMYQIDFEIQIHITRVMESNATDDASANSTTAISAAANATHTTIIEASSSSGDWSMYERETLTLSPVRTIAPSSRGDVVAELVGDFAAYAELSGLQGHWLMIPVQPGLSPNQILSSNLDMWSIFDPSMVSVTGECDKIGVSYTSFRHQTNACERPFGSCLNNQIFHFEVQDQSRMDRGLAPLYNVKRYGGGATNVGQAQLRPDGLVLKLPMTQMRSSVVTLSINADDLTFITNAGRARIVHASMEQFAAIQESGLLQVSVNNTGENPAMFYVSVIDCSADILPVLQKSAAIEGGVVRTFKFDVQARTDQAVTNATCSVVVANVLGDVTDLHTIMFSLAATVYGPIAEQGTSSGSDRPGNPASYKTCAVQCPNILSLKCSLLHRCWKRLFTGAAIIGSLLAAIYAVYASLPLVRRLNCHRPATCNEPNMPWMISNPSYAPVDFIQNQDRTEPKKGSRFAAKPIADPPIASHAGL